MNPRPIVGILAQELSYSLMEIFANKTSYIGAAYVKYIEAAGARVVPVLINQVSFCHFSFIQPLVIKFIGRVFLLRQLLIVNYYVKSLSNNISNENTNTGVSRKTIFQE